MPKKSDGGQNSQIVTLVSNMVAAAQVKELEGREWYVCPTIMGVVGVWNGSAGPVYYSAEQLGAWPGGWDHKPVIVYHPAMNGKSLSACDPEVINAQKVGILLNTDFDGVKLKTEVWIDKERVEKVDQRIVEAIENNKMVEVSTGLFAGLEKESGIWNGLDYNASAVDLKPDHLAILPDGVGACGIADGAGMLRNAKNQKDVEKLLTMHNALSFSEIRDDLSGAIKSAYGETSVWIVEVYDDYFVYDVREKMFKHSYNREGDNVVLTGAPVRVEQRILYEEATQSIVNANDGNSTKGASDMKLVDQIIANTGHTESDRAALEKMDEATLKKMLPVQNDEAAKADDENAEKKSEVETEPKAEKVENKEQPKPQMTLSEFISQPGLDPETKEFMTNGLREQKAKKESMIETILNADVGFVRDELSDKSVDFLQKIEEGIKRSQSSTAVQNRYDGQAPLSNAAADVPVPEFPSFNFDEK